MNLPPARPFDGAVSGHRSGQMRPTLTRVFGQAGLLLNGICQKHALPLVAIVPVVALQACGPAKPIFSVDLMDPPAFYQDSGIAPFAEPLPENREVHYVTSRGPSVNGLAPYGNEESTILRVGYADVQIAGFQDASATSIPSVSGSRSNPPDVDVQKISELGTLSASRHAAANPKLFPSGNEAVDRTFAQRLNQQIGEVEGDDIVIYVHGTRVDFLNPILTAAELRHYGGYRQTVLAYSWPAGQGFLSYLEDAEDAAEGAFQFRRLIKFLAANTKARKIHIVAHSAGTRLVSEALGQLGLEYKHLSPDRIRRDLKLGKIVLTGSDANPNTVGGYLIDGATRIFDSLMLYVSGVDQALSVSSFVFRGSERLGQGADNELAPYEQAFIDSIENLFIINVARAERADAGRGHSYLRESPWVSGDILAAVVFDLSPSERGLVRGADDPRWTFPRNYPAALQAALIAKRPDLLSSGPIASR